MPNAELVILEGLKHAIFIEATTRVLPHVRGFLLSQERNWEDVAWTKRSKADDRIGGSPF
jgi:hypothetical protein